MSDLEYVKMLEQDRKELRERLTAAEELLVTHCDIEEVKKYFQEFGSHKVERPSLSKA